MGATHRTPGGHVTAIATRGTIAAIAGAINHHGFNETIRAHCHRWARPRNPNDQGETIRSWFGTLYEDFNLDSDALKQLVLLAQFSDDGFRASNSIIDKLYKKKSNWKHLETPSAFVSKGVRNARKNIDPWFEWEW